MYELWLVMNIVWEIALDIWPLLALAGLAWLVLMAWALRRPGARWRDSVPAAAGIAAVLAVAVFLAVPALTRSSLGELAYWVDWANLAAIAIGVGIAALAFVWPLMAARKAGTA